MKFDDFSKKLKNTDKPVILLEGSRIVQTEDIDSLNTLAINLVKRLPSAMFRSGGAKGSDELFSEAVKNINNKALQIILPKKKKNLSNLENTISFDELPEAEQAEIFKLTIAATPSYGSLIDFYKKKQLGGAYYKTQYLLRDALKVYGSKHFGLFRADAGCFYVNSTKKGGGGTGHTIRVCKLLDVPVIEQTEWQKWF